MKDRLNILKALISILHTLVPFLIKTDLNDLSAIIQHKTDSFFPSEERRWSRSNQKLLCVLYQVTTSLA